MCFVEKKQLSLRKLGYYSISVFELILGIREWLFVIKLFLGLVPEGVNTVHLRKNGIKFQVRSQMDVWSVKETFLDRFYERYGTIIGEKWRIIDIGAGIGEFTLFASASHPDNFVYAFEPYPESFAFLQENVKANMITNVKLYPQAISDRTGIIALDISGDEPLQIRSESVETPLPRENQINVPSLSLADAFDLLKLENCELVKLDCEGAEYPILLNTPLSVFDKIERIILEYHDFGTFTHHDLEEHLARHGFTVHTYSNPVHDYLGYLSAQR